VFQICIPTYTLVVFGACAETLIIGGLAAFAPKILEEKFDILPSDSGFIMGIFASCFLFVCYYLSV
jgi:hypothetical protein